MTKELTRFLYGGDYNPDQWSEDTWKQDIKVFKQANINSATINVFLGAYWSLKKVSMILQNWIKLCRNYQMQILTL